MNLFRNNAMTTEKDKEKGTLNEDPPDGGWGWMVVVHCFLVRWPYHTKQDISSKLAVKFYIPCMM